MAVSRNDWPDIEALEQGFDAIERDARALLAGLTAAQGIWQPQPTAWSIAHCFDHLATANRVYFGAMEPSAERALREGRSRRRTAVPGLIGGWFVRSLEAPVNPRFKMRAPEDRSPSGPSAR